MDLVREDGSKCLGGALRRRGGRGLYQGSFRPEGFGATPELLAEAIVDGVSQAWKTDFRKRPADAALLESGRRLAEQRYRTEEWNHRR